MEKKKRNKSNDIWNDPLFLKGMLSSKEEASKFQAEYLKQHPDRQHAIERAVSDFRHVKLNNYVLSQDKKETLLARIHASHASRQHRKHKLYIYAGLLAACLIGLLLIPLGDFLNQPTESHKELSTNVLPQDSIQLQEVTLITSQSKSIELVNNTLIDCKSDTYTQLASESKSKQKQPIQQAPEEETWNTLIVPRGKRSSIILPDGSRVWVNSGSTLRFPASFTSDKRMIEVDGEIYIEVAKEKSRPFQVHTAGLTINVLGTKFNVTSYPDEASKSIVLVEGSVRVNTKENKQIKLSPHQRLSMNQDQNSVDYVDVNHYISWKDGLLLFNGEPMQEILRRLSRYYNIPIHCDPSIATWKCAGKLVLFEDIEQVIKTFSMLYDVNYRIESGTLFINRKT